MASAVLPAPPADAVVVILAPADVPVAVRDALVSESASLYGAGEVPTAVKTVGANGWFPAAAWAKVWQAPPQGTTPGAVAKIFKLAVTASAGVALTAQGGEPTVHKGLVREIPQVPTQVVAFAGKWLALALLPYVVPGNGAADPMVSDYQPTAERPGKKGRGAGGGGKRPKGPSEDDVAAALAGELPAGARGGDGPDGRGGDSTGGGGSAGPGGAGEGGAPARAADPEGRHSSEDRDDDESVRGPPWGRGARGKRVRSPGRSRSTRFFPCSQGWGVL